MKDINDFFLILFWQSFPVVMEGQLPASRQLAQNKKCVTDETVVWSHMHNEPLGSHGLESSGAEWLNGCDGTFAHESVGLTLRGGFFFLTFTKLLVDVPDNVLANWTQHKKEYA